LDNQQVERQGAVRCEKRSNHKGCEQFGEDCNAAFRLEALFSHGLLSHSPHIDAAQSIASHRLPKTQGIDKERDGKNI